MTAKDVVREADEAGLRLVRFLWCGNDGTVRAKASSLHGLEGRIQSGIGLTAAMQAMNALDQLQPVTGMGPVGEVRLVPDLETFRVLPYAPHAGRTSSADSPSWNSSGRWQRGMTSIRCRLHARLFASSGLPAKASR